MTDVTEIDEFDANWIKEVAGHVAPTVGAVATAVGPDVWAYSPNQPRKSDGKFGTGGGSGGGYVQPEPQRRHPVLDESADRAGIGVDDLVHRRFDEEHAKGLASAIDRVDRTFPGSLRGSVLFTEAPEAMVGGKETAGATSMDGKKVIISDAANKVPAMYQPDGDHSHSAGGDTTEGVLTHELNHVALDLGGARSIDGPKDAYGLAKTLPVPTKYAEGDRGDGRERAAELLTQAEFGQPSADAAGFLATVKASYRKKPGEPSAVTGEPDIWVYSPYQPRRPDGKFGSGGSGGGVGVGVSRERPDLGGGDVHTYGDLQKARKNPVIAEAESSTPEDLGALGIHVTSSRQVAGVFEGGGEPSLMLHLDKGSSLEDIDVGAAYMVRRNEQDSVITNVTGSEIGRLGLVPNGKLIRITGLPTDTGSRERIFKEIQESTPFASWDEKGGSVEVSYFDADLSRDTVRGLATFSAEHGGSMTLEPTHTRWTFHDEPTRAGAREYLSPSDPSVLRTAGEVIVAYPGRTATVAPVRRGGGPDLDGSGGAGTAAPDGLGLAARAQPQALTPWAYSPSQPRKPDGKFGTGGSKAAPSSGSSRPESMTAEDARVSLAAVGISADLADVDEKVRPEVVDSMLLAHATRPKLFEAMTVTVTSERLPLNSIAETRTRLWSGTPKRGGYDRGESDIVLNSELFRNADSIHGTIKDSYSKRWLAGDDVDHIVQHEVGHVFDIALGQKSLDLDYLMAGAKNRAASDYGATKSEERFAEEYAVIATGRSKVPEQGFIEDENMATVRALMDQHK